MKDTTVYHVGVVDGNGTCYSHNAHAQLLSEISKLFSLHKVHSVMLSSISYTIKRFMNWVDRRPNLFWFLNFLCTLFDPVQPHQFSFPLLWFIWLLVAPQRDGKILDFYHDYLHGRAQFFPGFSLISLILSNIFTPLEKLRREWIS